MDANHAIEVLRSITTEDIRRRLDEIAAEEQALRSLLRSTLARDRVLNSSRPPKRQEAAAK